MELCRLTDGINESHNFADSQPKRVARMQEKSDAMTTGAVLREEQFASPANGKFKNKAPADERCGMPRLNYITP